MPGCIHFFIIQFSNNTMQQFFVCLLIHLKQPYMGRKLPQNKREDKIWLMGSFIIWIVFM